MIVIGASNREDMIDPAILRPGRLDVKIKIERPRSAAPDIFSKYLLASAPGRGRGRLGRRRPRGRPVPDHRRGRPSGCTSDAGENRFLEVTYASGDKEVLYFKDFNSGR